MPSPLTVSFPAPALILKLMDKLRRDFLWQGNLQSKSEIRTLVIYIYIYQVQTETLVCAKHGAVTIDPPNFWMQMCEFFIA